MSSSPVALLQTYLGKLSVECNKYPGDDLVKAHRSVVVDFLTKDFLRGGEFQRVFDFRARLRLLHVAVVASHTTMLGPLLDVMGENVMKYKSAKIAQTVEALLQCTDSSLLSFKRICTLLKMLPCSGGGLINPSQHQLPKQGTIQWPGDEEYTECMTDLLRHLQLRTLAGRKSGIQQSPQTRKYLDQTILPLHEKLFGTTHLAALYMAFPKVSPEDARRHVQLLSAELEAERRRTQALTMVAPLQGNEDLVRDAILKQQSQWCDVARVEHSEMQERRCCHDAEEEFHRGLEKIFASGVEEIVRAQMGLSILDDQMHQQHGVIFDVLNIINEIFLEEGREQVALGSTFLERREEIARAESATVLGEQHEFQQLQIVFDSHAALNDVFLTEAASHKVLCKEELILHTKLQDERRNGGGAPAQNPALTSANEHTLLLQLAEEKKKREDQAAQFERLRASFVELKATVEATNTPRIPEGFAMKQIKRTSTTTEDVVETTVESSSSDSKTVSTDLPSCMAKQTASGKLCAGEAKE